NDCEAASNGVSVAAQGECKNDPGPGPEPGTGDCGGLAGLTCAADEYCQFDESALCGAADQLGKCQPKPQGCNKIYAPVCGCDGQTYGNRCVADQAGAPIAHPGPCGEGEPTTDPSGG
ncbi:MAG TPA: hypothetical protein VFS00_05550, partial [Polyangiaceae bacterium]|nr:hypothetical protein [Polyangiaceae bacterium]